MSCILSVLLSLATLGVDFIANDGWDDLSPIVTLIAIILIVGFAVIAAGWVIKRDV